MVVVAIVFVVTLFFIKNKTRFQNEENILNQRGLNVGTETLENLVNKDTDGDGILDWEEGLWGTDPTKKETTPGIQDSVAIEKLKAENRKNAKIDDISAENIENLTQTDKFSRELFSTIVTLNQNGTVDQATIDKLATTLAEKVQNPEIRKIYLISDLKIINDESVQAIQEYLNAFENIHKKYPDISYTVLDVLQEFMVDEENVDVTALTKLDPIIEQNNKIIGALIKTNVPQFISTFHLDIINSLERLGENASDIRLFDTDPILSMGGITQYEKNLTQLQTSLSNFGNAIAQKFNN